MSAAPIRTALVGYGLAGAMFHGPILAALGDFQVVFDDNGVVKEAKGDPLWLDKNVTPDPAILETSRYFDSVNFAPRIKAATEFSIGFLDTVTPPTGQFAAFNAISAPKELYPAPDNGHGHDDPKLWGWVADLISKKAAEQKTPGS